MLNTRLSFLLIALSSGALIATALYFQHVMGLEPCYLCIVQRVFVLAVGVIAFIAFVHNPGTLGRRIYAFSAALTASAGSGFSLRQLWLQSLPEELVPTCGPPAEYLLEKFPLDKWLPMLLQGSGDCAKVDWAFLGFSIAGWLLFCFCVLALFAFWQGLRPQPR